MYGGFGLKIQHLNNLITRKVYAELSDGAFPYISHSAFQTLDFLYRHSGEEVLQKDIEKALVINRATTSKMLRQLEEKGLIARTDSARDARHRVVVLTAQGQLLRAHALEKMKQIDAFFLQLLTTEEFDAFNRMYATLRAALED